MTMTVTDIREHAMRLQGRLDDERHRVVAGHYSGHPRANLALIAALEGRVAELLRQCDELQRRDEALTAGPAAALV